MIKRFIMSINNSKPMITEKLTEFIIQTKYRKIPEDAIEKAKLCFLDFLAVALRGSKTKSGIAVGDIISKGDESTVIGYIKASCLDASLANGIFAHSLDLDDGHRIAQLHPGACVIPAALSICEAYNKSGKDFISSLVTGYEVAISLGTAVNPQHRNRGFHSTGTCGTFGAAASACKALDLGKKKILNALGLAGTQACGLLESDHAGTMGKHLHAGKAAQSGVLSALLAKRDFTGASTIVDGEEGFLFAMVDPDVDKIDKRIDIGKFNIQEVYFKKYPVCRHLHSTIDATLGILNEAKDIKVWDIQKIIVKTYEIAAKHDNYNPKTKEAIKQSLPVSLAIAIAKGNLCLDNLEISEEIPEISNRIVIECNENFDALYPYKRPSEVTIYTKNQKYEKKVDLARGEPENPLKKHEIIDKFASLNPNVNVDILKMIDDLESYNMRDMMSILNHEFKKDRVGF